MSVKRVRIVITGAVQGIGFRPFVYRLANELQLAGYVSNSGQGVLIEAEGAENQLGKFVARLEMGKPPLSVIQSLQCSFIPPRTDERFEIHSSEASHTKTAIIQPDLATCGDCLRELFDVTNRRYLYPFTNCTHCGPRFSIIEALPYDRANTSMKVFQMCPECSREYHDPENRRFHAQPNACPECGPRLELWNAAGHCLRSEHEALLHAAAAIRSGQIVAMRGIGGFQLMVDARNEESVQRLRLRKCREERPFAVMFPSLATVEDCCSVAALERELLLSSASPIVLLAKSSRIEVAPSVAPGNPLLGIMLPYSPLHHLLMRELNFPVVATSANISGEPICISNSEALERLQRTADVFLVHNRPIVRHMDDSVVRVVLGREMILRRARGYAPLPISCRLPESQPILAVGAHLKNTVALALEDQVILSQHIGDLDTAQALSAFQRSAADLRRLYETSPQIIAHDLHPEYLSTKFAQQQEIRPIGVQHHYAHVLSCMVDNDLTGSVLGVAWDGTGMGTDQTIWGGEFLRINESSFNRFAHLRQFRLPGGEAAIKQPRRCALGLLYEIFGSEIFGRIDLPALTEFSQSELLMLHRMLDQGINSPVTSSAGRFFDALASIIGLRHRSSFEGQAAMELEFACAKRVDGCYPFELRKTNPIVCDWKPAVLEILDERRRGAAVSIIAARLHNTLAQMIVAVVRASGETNVVLSGGCFQNKYLTERAVRRLREEGFSPYWHRRVPPNDGGIALGQVIAARRAATSSQPQQVQNDAVDKEFVCV